MPTSPGAPIFTRLTRAELLALMKSCRPKPMSSGNDSRADKKPVKLEPKMCQHHVCGKTDHQEPQPGVKYKQLKLARLHLSSCSS